MLNLFAGNILISHHLMLKKTKHEIKSVTCRSFAG